MGNSVRIETGKNASGRKVRLADVKKAKQRAARKAASSESAFVKRMQADVTNELKQIKTQQQLTNIKEMVEAYGSKTNRTEFEKLNNVFKKEARTLIDTELATITTREQLESIRSMVDLNGTQAQKAKFAQFESYFTRPTWEKYANLHGSNYSFPTSGVGEADRIAEEIISKNNLKEAEVAAKEADKVARKTGKALAASASMEAFLNEGDRLIEQGRTVAPKPQPVVVENPRVTTGTTGAGILGVTPSETPVITQPTNTPTANGGQVKPQTVTTSPTTPKISGTTPQDAANPASKPAKKAAAATAAKTAKYAKYFKRGVFGLALAATAGLFGYLGLKAGMEEKKKASVETEPVEVFEGRDLIKEQEQEKDSVKNASGAKKATSKKVQPDKNAKTQTVKETPVQTVASTENKTMTADAQNVTNVAKVGGIYTDKEVAESLEKNSNLGNSKFYIVKKGDCVWKYIEKRLKANKAEFEAIKLFLKDKYGKEPSYDAIVLHATKMTCVENGIRYIIDDKKLIPGDTLYIPKFDQAA